MALFKMSKLEKIGLSMMLAGLALCVVFLYAGLAPLFLASLVIAAIGSLLWNPLDIF